LLCAIDPDARRIGCVDRLGDNTLVAKLAGVLEDEFAVACIMAVVLKAGLNARIALRLRAYLNESLPRRHTKMPASK
jgi:hypothetical protein